MENESQVERKEKDEELEKVDSFKKLKALLVERGQDNMADEVEYWQSGFEHIGSDLEFVTRGVDRYFPPDIAEKMKKLLDERAAELKKQGKDLRKEMNETQGRREKKSEE